MSTQSSACPHTAESTTLESAATSMAVAAEGAAVQALRSILHRVSQAAERSSRPASKIRVVAVGKTKPVSMIRDVYDAGHRHFGENYVQELLEKAPELPDDIHWHFIGHLQSNKAKALVAGVPNLFMVEGVDNTKEINNKRVKPIGFWVNGNGTMSLQADSSLATQELIAHGQDHVANNLDKAVAGLERPPLNVLVQVNTSGEESKYGVEPSECVELAKHIKLQCPNLKFLGLMTIGMLDYSSRPENFKTLFDCRQRVSKELNVPEEELELSMGMSGDFEQAIEMGSTNVRVGSTIFGPRDYSNKK